MCSRSLPLVHNASTAFASSFQVVNGSEDLATAYHIMTEFKAAVRARDLDHGSTTLAAAAKRGNASKPRVPLIFNDDNLAVVKRDYEEADLDEAVDDAVAGAATGRVSTGSDLDSE